MTLFRKFVLTMAVCTAMSATAEIDLPTRVVDGKTYYYYKVPPKETVYSITRRYGISRDDLMKYNPQLIDGLRAGDTIIFPVAADDEPEPQHPADETESPVEIVSVVEEEGGVIAIAEPAPSVPASGIIPLVPLTPAVTAPADSDAVNIVVMLPFMLEHESITRQAQNQTNFYRGLLLGVDSLASADTPINLTTFDTESSTDTVKSLMTSPAVQNADFIIAPGDSLAIETIAEVADTTGATVINLFGVKNDAHLRHASVLQANIPHDAMYVRAIKAFCKQFKNHKVLILNATDIAADKQEFVDELTASLVKAGIPYEQIDYTGKLTPEDLGTLPARDYITLPTASSREALLKILPSLTEFADQNPDIDVRLFGYPEWVVLRGDIKDKLHKLDTVVYSRFSTDLDGTDVTAVNRAYAKWYGSEPERSLPDTMLLGFDTIGWILHATANGFAEPYTGLQNSFQINELPDAGDVNEALYFINFTRSGRVDAQAL